MEEELEQLEIPSKEEIGYKPKEEKFNECEKCGGEMGHKMAGDESYLYCSGCKNIDAR